MRGAFLPQNNKLHFEIVKLLFLYLCISDRWCVYFHLAQTVVLIPNLPFIKLQKLDKNFLWLQKSHTDLQFFFQWKRGKQNLKTHKKFKTNRWASLSLTIITICIMIHPSPVVTTARFKTYFYLPSLCTSFRVTIKYNPSSTLKNLHFIPVHTMGCYSAYLTIFTLSSRQTKKLFWNSTLDFIFPHRVLVNLLKWFLNCFSLDAFVCFLATELNPSDFTTNKFCGN